MDRYQLGTRDSDGLAGTFLFVDEKEKKYLSISAQQMNGERRLRSLTIGALQPGTLSGIPIIQNSKQSIILDFYFNWAEKYLSLTNDDIRHEEGLTESQMQELRSVEDDLLRILP